VVEVVVVVVVVVVEGPPPPLLLTREDGVCPTETDCEEECPDMPCPAGTPPPPPPPPLPPTFPGGIEAVGVSVGTGIPGVMVDNANIGLEIGFGIPMLVSGTDPVMDGNTLRAPNCSPGGHVEGPGMGALGPVVDFPNGSNGAWDGTAPGGIPGIPPGGTPCTGIAEGVGTLIGVTSTDSDGTFFPVDAPRGVFGDENVGPAPCPLRSCSS